MKHQTKPAPAYEKKRTGKPLMLFVPPEEHARLEAFALRMGRPRSWVVRDALRAYLDALEGNAAQVEALRLDPKLDLGPDVAAPMMKMGKAGRTQPRANVRKLAL